MFKKGDVVTYCGETEDTGFDVRVTDVDTFRIGVFYGAIISAKLGSTYEHSVSDVEHAWDAKQFKLKQQTVVSAGTPNNAFPVLKDGMVIETRCRGFYLVCADKVIRHDGYNRVTSYEKDGKHKGSDSNFDIMRVYSGEHLYNFDLYEYVSDYPQDLVWNGKKNADKIASLRSQVDSLQEQIKQLEEEDNV